MKDTRWFIEVKTYQRDKLLSCTVCEGLNSYGDGPERTIGVFNALEDAEHICALHNAAILSPLQNVGKGE